MLKSKIDTLYIKKDKNDRIHQGDILKDFYIIDTFGIEGTPIKKTSLPYSVVMNQDCDLEWDFLSRINQDVDNDKFLPSVLICPAYQAEKFYEGTHIEGWKMQGVRSSDDRKKIRNNDEKNRLHFLPGETALGVPDLIIDFKHFYTVPRSFLYSQTENCYLITISELFRERLSQRFANYLSRFGLPELNHK